jgi:hypothetical protein
MVPSKHLCGGTEKTHDSLVRIADLRTKNREAELLITTPRCSQANFLDVITRILRFCGLLNGVVNSSGKKALNGNLTSNELGRRSNFRYNPGICLDGLRKSMKPPSK